MMHIIPSNVSNPENPIAIACKTTSKFNLKESLFKTILHISLESYEKPIPKY